MDLGRLFPQSFQFVVVEARGGQSGIALSSQLLLRGDQILSRCDQLGGVP